MSERTMVESVETALRELGDSEAVSAAGQLLPRGHTGSMFAGGFIGSGVGGGVGGVRRLHRHDRRSVSRCARYP